MAINNSRTIKNYAAALYEVSGKQTPKVLSELLEIEKVFEVNKKLAGTLDDASVSRKEQEKFIATLIKGTSKITQNFIYTLADNRHFDLLEPIVVEFNETVNRSNHQSIVTVTTAEPLTKTDLNKIGKVAQTRFNLEHIEVQNVIDPSIIGGVVINAGGKTIDGSVKYKLAQIGRHLKSEIVEEKGANNGN
ncbi:MAG: F0F1 ATP synthase subunit delta [Lactobacillaceae bacterium]|jgi:F-type H+-transporting ATPase subunit delta|nr:F0F1 ATP synthase subunit delta [Lactobacillaceae bacterium]